MTEKQRLDPLDDATIVEYAREIVTGRMLIADILNTAWQSSLFLMLEALRAYENLGAILVPVAPHVRGYWINGVAPGITVECIPVPEESLAAIDEEMDRMRRVLYPEMEER